MKISVSENALFGINYLQSFENYLIPIIRGIEVKANMKPFCKNFGSLHSFIFNII